MSALPNGYVSLREAGAILEKVLFAGLPERPEILKVRAEHGMSRPMRSKRYLYLIAMVVLSFMRPSR